MANRYDNRLSKNEARQLNKRIDTSRIYMAKVMDTRTPTKAGEILVHILDSGLDEKDNRNWFLASYASGFFGTNYYEGGSGSKGQTGKSYEKDPQSFGAWFPMPCVGNFVFVFFPVVSGEDNRCYWFACPVNPGKDYMVPGIACKIDEKNDKESEPKALSDRNTLRFEPKENKVFNGNVAKSLEEQAEYEPLNIALKRQGLTKDDVRGYSTATPKRETPSFCYGIKTPLGNTLIMDDGFLEDKDAAKGEVWTFKLDEQDRIDDGDINKKRQLVGSDGKSPWQRKYGDKLDKRKYAGFRFRTRNGSEIVIADEGTIYAINAEGSCWVEISKNGYLEGWSKTGVSIASEGNINLHSKESILIECDKTIAMKAKKMNIETTGDINVAKTPHIITKAEIRGTNIQCEEGNITTLQSSGAKLKGRFEGTLKGFAETAEKVVKGKKLEPLEIDKLKPEYKDDEDETKCVPCQQKKREVHQEGANHGEDEPLEKTINTKVTTHEPYCGHCKRCVEEEDTKGVDKDETCAAGNDDTENDNQENNDTDESNESNENNSSNCNGCNNSIGSGSCNGSSCGGGSCSGGSCSGGSCGNSSPISSCNGCGGVTNQVNKTPTKSEISKKAKEDNVPMINLSQNFTLPQLCYSDTAVRNGVTNKPSSEETANLQALCQNVLEPIMQQYGQLNINSGYRCYALNVMVGGARASQHMTGEAVDIEVPGTSNWELAEWIKKNLQYDQLILENCTDLENDPSSGWIHISYSRMGNRKQDLTIKCGSTQYGLWK